MSHVPRLELWNVARGGILLACLAIRLSRLGRLDQHTLVAPIIGFSHGCLDANLLRNGRKNAQRQRFSASVVTPQTIKWLMPLSRRILFKPVMKKAPLPCPTRLRTANWLWPGFGTMISPSSAIRFYRFYNFHQFYSIFIQCSSIFHCCQAFLGATNLSSHIGPISCRVAFGFAPSTKSLPGDPLTSSRPIPSTITCVQLMNLLPWAPAQSACLVADIAAHPVSSPFFQAVSHPTRSDTAVPQVFAVCLTYDIMPFEDSRPPWCARSHRVARFVQLQGAWRHL